MESNKYLNKYVYVDLSKYKSTRLYDVYKVIKLGKTKHSCLYIGTTRYLYSTFPNRIYKSHITEISIEDIITKIPIYGE